jgi:TIR domain
MSGTIFISYRRDDSAHFAGRLHERLTNEFGSKLLFMDIASIRAGDEFVEVLKEQIANCDALLAIIGPKWLEASDKQGGRRLDNTDDFVRVEIAAALARGIRVIPILHDGADMPDKAQLPEDLEGLTRRNALQFNHASFGRDMQPLIEVLKERKPPVGGLMSVLSTAKPTFSPDQLEKMAEMIKGSNTPSAIDKGKSPGSSNPGSSTLS